MTEISATEAFVRWLKRLRDDKAKGMIVERVQRMARGLPGDVKSVGGEISELRVHIGPGYRIYFTCRGGTLVVLLCGGNKDTQARDIAKAKQLAGSL